MNLLPLIDKLINEHGSAAILRERLALLRDQVALLEQQNATLIAESNKLIAVNKDLDLRCHNLEEQITAIKRAEEFSGDKCPYCQKAAGKLLNLKPHAIFGDVGMKTGDYECQNCKRTYDREHRPDLR